MPKQPMGSIKRHRGRWTARVTFTHPITKRRKEWRRVANPNTKAVAGELVREKVRRLQAGVYEDDARDVDPGIIDALTFREVAEKYLEAYVSEPIYENGIKIRGMKDHRGVRSVVTNVFLPALGRRPIASIRHADLIKLRDKRLDEPKLHGWTEGSGADRVRKVATVKGKRSIARVNREMATLRAIFNFALDSGYLEKSPMRGERKQSLVVMAAERGRDRVLTLAEERRLLAAFAGDKKIARTRDFVVAAIDTGMRRSELLNLEERDVDLAAGVLRLRWEATKSKRSRMVPISSRVRAVLTARLTGTATNRIFANLSETIVRNDFTLARERAKLADFRLHDCRATVATRLLQAGVSEAEIAMMTGHRVQRGNGDASTLRKHYLRLTPETLDRATGAINEAIN